MHFGEFMNREEISIYIDNAVLMNKLVTKEEARDILNEDFAQGILQKDTLLGHLIDSIQIGDALFKKDFDNHIILVYFRPHYKKIDLKNYVDIIGDYAFYYNDIIEEVYGSTVIKVCQCGFLLCHNLKKAVFPNVYMVGESGFNYCGNLVYVVMKPRIIGKTAFYNCRKLRKFDFSNVESIASDGFSITAIERVIAPKLEDVGKDVFFFFFLKTVDVPKLDVSSLISKEDVERHWV